MIPTKARESRRMKVLKLSKNLERKYKEVNCRECTVVVTPMDFAKILGRFTKVKIQYESSSKSKPKQTNVVSPNSRLKAKENGMVQLHRHAYNAHPAHKLLGQKNKKLNTPTTPTSNVLKENNRLKKEKGALEYSDKPLMKSKVKYYGVVFDKPPVQKTKDTRNKISLQDLVSDINKSILPAADWCIDFFPKNGEPKDDKIYDRIAAELEDLMYNEKSKSCSNVKDSKNDEFPSILDILNENTKEGATKASNPASSLNLESSDVEAMLLGNASPSIKSAPMEVDSTESSFVIKEAQQENKPEENKKAEEASTIDDNPESPSILDEHIQKETSSTEQPKVIDNDKAELTTSQTSQIDENDNTNKKNKNSTRTNVTQIIFKKLVNGTCSKLVTCPKNLKYSISMLGQSVELVGAPKYISSLDDLQVLLQIVEESELDNLYVHH